MPDPLDLAIDAAGPPPKSEHWSNSYVPPNDPLDLAVNQASAPAKPAYLTLPETNDDKEERRGDFGRQAVGAGETAAQMLTSQFGQAVGGLRGLYDLATGSSLDEAANNIRKTQDALTYEPRTSEGKRIAAVPGEVLGAARDALNRQSSGVGDVVTAPGEALGEIGNRIAGPVGGAIGATIPTALGLVAGAKAPIANVGGDAATGIANAARAAVRGEEMQGGAGLAGFASGGSAATSIQAGLATATPELQAGIQQLFEDAQTKYGKDWQSHIDFNAIKNQLEADSLPIPGRLSQAHASEDPTAISEFVNNRAKDPRVPQFIQATNKNLADNLSAIRDQAAPDVVTTNAPEHGDTIIQAYKDLDAPKVGAIRDAYQALEDANGGAFPVDAQTLAQNVNEALSKKLLSKQDPGGQFSELRDLAQRGGMTMENYLSMRQNLGDVARTSADPAARTAASTMIQELEKLPLEPGAPTEIRDLATQARTLARNRFQELEADPAYADAVEGKTDPDKFIAKHVIGGTRATLSKMAENLSDNDVARQTMSAAVIDHLRDAARLNPNFEGNFAADSFNKQVQRFAPSAQYIFRNGEGQTLQTLSDYAKRSTAQPKGSFNNNSNTAVAQAGGLLPTAGKLAGFGAENLLPGFVTNVAKFALNKRAASLAEQQLDEQFRRATMPGAGAIK